MTIKIKLDVDSYYGLTKDEIREAKTLLAVIGASERSTARFQHFFRCAIRALLKQCEDPEHEKLIQWPIKFEMQERTPGFISGRYARCKESLSKPDNSLFK